MSQYKFHWNEKTQPLVLAGRKFSKTIMFLENSRDFFFQCWENPTPYLLAQSQQKHQLYFGPPTPTSKQTIFYIQFNLTHVIFILVSNKKFIYKKGYVYLNMQRTFICDFLTFQHVPGSWVPGLGREGYIKYWKNYRSVNFDNKLDVRSPWKAKESPWARNVNSKVFVSKLFLRKPKYFYYQLTSTSVEKPSFMNTKCKVLNNSDLVENRSGMFIL